jgi:hypothetical protein
LTGSQIALKTAWKTALGADAIRAADVAKTRVAIGELEAPPKPPPQPAIALKARVEGALGDGTTVTATPEAGKPPLEALIEFVAVRTDTWAGLLNGESAAMKIGVDAAPGAPTDPPKGSGLVVIKKGSTGASTKVPVASKAVLKKGDSVDLKDADGKLVAKLLPADDYVGKGGLSYAVVVTGETFTISATYDSSAEDGAPAKATLLTLATLPPFLTYLVSASAPSRGAALPAHAVTAKLSGGAPGVPATGLLYTS